MALRLVAVVLGKYGLIFLAIRSLVAIGSTFKAVRLEPELWLGGTGRSTTVGALARTLGLRQGCHCHSDDLFEAWSRCLRELLVGVIVPACAVIASSCQWTHRRLLPSAMLVQDGLLLACLFIILDRLNDVLVILDELIAGHLVLEHLR